MAYSGSVVSVGFYFRDQPALASGVVVAGTGIGIMTFPLLAQSLIDHYDLDGALLLLGAVTFQASVFGALIRPHPLEIERQCVTSKSIFKTITDHIIIIIIIIIIIMLYLQKVTQLVTNYSSLRPSLQQTTHYKVSKDMHDI